MSYCGRCLCCAAYVGSWHIVSFRCDAMICRLSGQSGLSLNRPPERHKRSLPPQDNMPRG